MKSEKVKNPAFPKEVYTPPFKDERVQKALSKILSTSIKPTEKTLQKIKRNFELYLLIGRQGDADKTRLIISPGRIEDLLDFSNTVDVFKMGILRPAKGDYVSFVHIGYAMVTPQMLGEPQTDRLDIRLIPVVLLVHSTKMARQLGYKVNLFRTLSPQEVERQMTDWSAYLISYLLPKLQVAEVQKDTLTKAYNEETFDMLYHAQKFARNIVIRTLQNPENYEESLFDRIMQSLSENWKAWVILLAFMVFLYILYYTL